MPAEDHLAERVRCSFARSEDAAACGCSVRSRTGQGIQEVAAPLAPACFASFTDADAQRIAALPAAAQVDEVRKELMRCNPGFDGKLGHKIEDGVVTKFRIVTDGDRHLTDPGLQCPALLDCRGSVTQDVGHGRLADLTPLRGSVRSTPASPYFDSARPP